MQKHILKFGAIISIILLVMLVFLESFVYATSENVIAASDEVTIGENTYANEIDNSADLENNVLADNETASNSVSNNTVADEDVYSTGVTNTTTPTSSVSSSTKQISSYSTVSSLPEANLGLNNILNVILIAIGVIIILLAIAILVRLKQ
jgi:hypothetical protein